jgi:hypothetical protein
MEKEGENMNPFVEIHNIFERYETAPNKRELDKSLRELGSMIEERTRTDRERKINAILDKKGNMTKSDIEYLIGNEVPHRIIRKALNMSFTAFSAYVRNNGLTGKKGNSTNKWEKAEVDLVKKALKEGKSITETVELLNNRSYNAVAVLRSEIRRGMR